MKKTVTRLGIAVACSALLVAPAAAQGTGSATEAPTAGQHGGSGRTGGATDQQGSTHADQIGEEEDGEAGRVRREHADDTAGQGTTGTTGEADAPRRGTEARDTAAGATDARTATDDRSFVVKAAAGSMAEIKFGHLGADKASNPQVKQFAQRMVEDHAKVNEDLMSVARELELASPHALRPEDLEAYERISKLSGEEFDRAFLAHLVQDHARDLQMFRQKAQRAEHDRVREFAASKLPLLEQHYRRAQQLQQTVGGQAAGTGQDRDTRGTTGTTGTAGTAGERDRVYQGDEDQHRSQDHVHDEGQGGPEEQPGTSTGTPPQ
jgi:putative membrane protein